jgi:uncharacterized membrane protein
MHILRLLLRRETLAPLAALSFATAVCVALIFVRVLFTRNFNYVFLIWNLFLAWLPLLFAVLARAKYQEAKTGERPGWSFLALGAAWLLFFPNAAYICTDLVHLTNRFFGPFWVDLAVILSCAFTGLVLGFVSLYLMQSVVTHRYGRLTGWVFVAGMTGLSAFGIYLGRFLRFNSWDVLAQPGKLYQGISAFATGQAHSHHFAFLAMFATFLFLAYLMLYALTHLPTAMHVTAAPVAPTNSARA